MQQLGGASEAETVDEDNDLRRRPVFLLSSGRSGSTLVQRLLNCHRDLVLWGEHFGFLGGPAAALAQMNDPQQRRIPATADENNDWRGIAPQLRNPGDAIEWVNPWSTEEYAEQVRSFMESYFSGRLQPGQRWGFKEIRYNSLPVLRGLHQLYPDARFIFLKRDPIEVTRSKIFAFVKESEWNEMHPLKRRTKIRHMLRDLEIHVRALDAFVVEQPDAAILIGYEELVAKPHEVLRRSLDHLQLDAARFDWELAEQVLAQVITTTKRDDELVDLIREVQAEREHDMRKFADAVAAKLAESPWAV